MRHLTILFVGGLAVSLYFAASVLGDDPENENIQWVLPGDFEDALERAKAENRIILIKGLGFGLDELGSKCATKGCW